MNQFNFQYTGKQFTESLVPGLRRKEGRMYSKNSMCPIRTICAPFHSLQEGKVVSVGLNKNAPHRPRHLNTWTPVGVCVPGNHREGGMSLGEGFERLQTHVITSSLSMLHVCGLNCKLLTSHYCNHVYTCCHVSFP